MQPDYRIIFFVLSLLAAAPVLYYYYRRSPNPRFRPRLGEMALVSLFALFLCGGFSYFVGGFMQNPDDFREIEAISQPPSLDETEDSKDESREKSERGSGTGFQRDRPGQGGRGSANSPKGR
jgi:hypothetical protein